MRRLLLTGGAGLLSLNWARAVASTWDVHRVLHFRPAALPWSPSSWVALDGSEFATLLATFRPDLVIHTAGLTNVEACERDPGAAQHVNVDLAAAVARACAETGTRLVHISTDHLWSGKTAMVSEDVPPEPVNVYARTKAEAEAAVLEAKPAAMVVRTNFYGWGPSYRPSFSDWIIGALRQGRRITLFDDVVFTPILVDILAEAVHELVDRGVGGIIHLGSDDCVSKHEFGRLLAGAFGLDAGLVKVGKLLETGGLVVRPKDMSLANSKALTLLGRQIGTVREHLRKLVAQEADALVGAVRAL